MRFSTLALAAATVGVAAARSTQHVGKRDMPQVGAHAKRDMPVEKSHIVEKRASNSSYLTPKTESTSSYQVTPKPCD